MGLGRELIIGIIASLIAGALLLIAQNRLRKARAAVFVRWVALARLDRWLLSISTAMALLAIIAFWHQRKPVVTHTLQIASIPSELVNPRDSILEWAAKQGLPVQSEPAWDLSPKELWVLAIRSRNCLIMVASHKGREDYIDFQTDMYPSSPMQAAFKKMSTQEQITLRDSITNAANNTGLGYFVFGSTTLAKISLTQSIPVRSLSEENFYKALNDLDSGTVRCLQAVRLELDKVKG